MKSAFRFLLTATMLGMLIVVPEIGSLVSFSNSYSGPVGSQSSTVTYPPGRVFLNQTFDNETVGTIPTDWFVTNPSHGNISVVNGGFDISNRSAVIITNSSAGEPDPYRYFEQQTRTIGLSFAVKPTDNSENSSIEVIVDDSNFNGANIVFEHGKIGYHQNQGGVFILRSSYVPDRWYKIRFILNIPQNVYNIYIDDHLEAVRAGFLGNSIQLNRIKINATSSQDGIATPVGYVDELFGRQVIEIPTDYSTIQEGINAASPGDIVFVTGQRAYYESVTITKSIELVGENVNTTIIDRSHEPPKSQSDGLIIQANNVLVHELTIRSTPYGTGIVVYGANNTVENNIVTNGLGDGVRIVGPNTYLTGNIITSNLKSGIRISAPNCSVADNIIMMNDECGIIVSHMQSNVSDNLIKLNLDCGIQITAGSQSVFCNNTIQENGVGVKCEAAAKKNKFYQNCFIGNNQTPQAIDLGGNTWDDGYPFSFDNKTGGGNYWSDFDCFDIYRGPNQDQLCPLCLPSPDGIADRPYNLSSQVQDRYPFFLIQNVSQSPDNIAFDLCGAPIHSVEYDTPVNVTAQMLHNVEQVRAFILVDFNSTALNVTMTKTTDNVWRGTIPGGKYGMEISYNVSTHVNKGVEVNSTSYPLSGPYFVNDTQMPRVTNVTWSPLTPDEKQPVIVSANVTEPMNASGVGGVYLSYKFNDTWWTANMSLSTGSIYVASIPPQPGNASLQFMVSAVDKAGNGNPGGFNNTNINNLPQLYVTNNASLPYSTDPCPLDEAVMYRGETKNDTSLTIINIGQEPLAWNVTSLNRADWLNITSPISGVILPGRNITISMIVNTTTCRDPNLYVAEFAVNANGSIPRWAVIAQVLVRDVLIDESWCSSPAPMRVNVNATVDYAFHAIWMHNSTDAVSGTIKLSNGNVTNVNATGWAYFSGSENVGKKTYSVTQVDFNYTQGSQLYHIRSFVQQASNVTVVWDRVDVVLKLADDRVDIDSDATIMWADSVYESDKSVFSGFPFFNDTLNKHTVGRYSITTSAIYDTKYGLTAFTSNVVSCVWDDIKINAGGVSSKQIEVDKSGTVWFVGIYDFDNLVFKGANGTLYVDVYEFNVTSRKWQNTRTDPMDWSGLYDHWEKTYTFNTAGPKIFTISTHHPIEDREYNLTATNDLVGPIDMTWGPLWPRLPPFPDPSGNSTVPVTVQSWAFPAIITTVVVGLLSTSAIMVFSGKKPSRRLRPFEEDTESVRRKKLNE